MQARDTKTCCPDPSAARELAYPGGAHETSDRLARRASTLRSAENRELGRSRFGRFDGREVLQSSRRRWVDRLEQQKPLLRVTIVHVTIRLVRGHDRTALTLRHDLFAHGTALFAYRYRDPELLQRSGDLCSPRNSPFKATHLHFDGLATGLATGEARTGPPGSGGMFALHS